MSRFYGKVGYANTGELVGGEWENEITERDYYGDVLNESVTEGSADKVNNDIRLSERISVVADAYALGNYAYIKYVIKDEGGVAWEVTTVELKRPRLILSLGGVYHGSRPTP